MAIDVIVLLEIVEVEHEKGELVFLPVRPREFDLKGVKEVAVIIKPGEIVGDREASNLLLEPLFFANDFGFLDTLLDHINQMVVFKRFPDVVGRSVLEGLDRIVHRSICR